MLKARGAFTNLEQVNDNLLAIRNSTWKNEEGDFNDKSRCLHCMASFETNFQINIFFWCHLHRWKRCSSWPILMATCYCVALNSGESCKANRNLHNAPKITLKDLQFSRYHNNWTGRRWKELRKATRPSPSWIATATTRSAWKSSSRSIRLKHLKYMTRCMVI